MGLIRKTLHVATGGAVQPHSLKQRQHGSPGRGAHKLPAGELAGAYLRSGRDRQEARRAGLSLKDYRKSQAAAWAQKVAEAATVREAQAPARAAALLAGAQAKLLDAGSLAVLSWQEAYAVEHSKPGCCPLHHN